MDGLEQLIELATQENVEDIKDWETIQKLLFGTSTENIGHVIITLMGLVCLRNAGQAHVLLHILYSEFHPRMTNELN